MTDIFINHHNKNPFLFSLILLFFSHRDSQTELLCLKLVICGMNRRQSMIGCLLHAALTSVVNSLHFHGVFTLVFEDLHWATWHVHFHSLQIVARVVVRVATQSRKLQSLLHAAVLWCYNAWRVSLNGSIIDLGVKWLVCASDIAAQLIVGLIIFVRVHGLVLRPTIHARKDSWLPMVRVVQTFICSFVPKHVRFIATLSSNIDALSCHPLFKFGSSNAIIANNHALVVNLTVFSSAWERVGAIGLETNSATTRSCRPISTHFVDR